MKTFLCQICDREFAPADPEKSQKSQESELVCEDHPASEKYLFLAKKAEANELCQFAKKQMMVDGYTLSVERNRGKFYLIGTCRNNRINFGKCTDVDKISKKIAAHEEKILANSQGWKKVINDMREEFSDSSIACFLLEEKKFTYTVVASLLDISLPTVRRKIAAVDEKDYEEFCKQYEYLVTGII